MILSRGRHTKLINIVFLNMYYFILFAVQYIVSYYLLIRDECVELAQRSITQAMIVGLNPTRRNSLFW